MMGWRWDSAAPSPRPLVNFAGAGSRRLRNRRLAPLDPNHDGRVWVAGWAHEVPREGMLGSARHRASGGHAQSHGTCFRLSGEEVR